MRDRGRDLDKTFTCLILLVIAILFTRLVVEELHRLRPDPPPLTTEKKINPAPVRGVCDWLPLDSGCPGAKKVRK
jgi:hypothetical protein